MKIYDREKKRWIEKEDSGKSLKKRELCRGGKTHNLILKLPYMCSSNRELTQQEIESVYKIKELEKEQRKTIRTEYAKFGIFIGYGINDISTLSREFECEVCGKKVYAYK